MVLPCITIVHGLGCHLDATLDGAVDWYDINWAKGTPQGRIAQVIRVATMRDATCISFGTGASEKNGIKEAEYMRRTAEMGVLLMEADSMVSKLDIHRMKQMLHTGVARVDDVTQNTTEEIRAVFDWALEEFPDDHVEIIFVTSAFHAARTTNEAAKVAHELYLAETGVGTRIYYSISPSYDSPGDTFVFEQSHRGDMPKIDWTPLKKLFGLFGHPEELQRFVNRVGGIAERLKKSFD